MPEKVVELAVRRLPPELRERYREEWLGELDALRWPPLSKLVFAVAIWVRASKMLPATYPDVQRPPAPAAGAKRALDVALASLLFLLYAPLGAAIWGRLKLRRPTRPALARYTVTGSYGRPIHVYTFPTHGLTSLYPLLFNVLRGDLSIVGPRPVDDGWFTAAYGVSLTDYRPRQAVRPGLVGPWSKGLLTRPMARELRAIDERYVSTWSFFGDVKLMIHALIHCQARATGTAPDASRRSTSDA